MNSRSHCWNYLLHCWNYLLLLRAIDDWISSPKLEVPKMSSRKSKRKVPTPDQENRQHLAVFLKKLTHQLVKENTRFAYNILGL